MPIVAASYAGGLTAATSVKAAPVTFNGFTVNASNTGGASTITFWNNAAGTATGTILYQITIPTQTAANTQIFNFPSPIVASVGIAITVATTAVGDIVLWLN